MKIWRKILFWIAVVVLAVPLAACVAIQLPSVQTYICQKAAVALSESIDGEASVGSVHLVPLHTLVVGNVALTDRDGDTVFNSKKLLLNVKGLSIWSDTLVVHRVSIDRTSLTITTCEDGKTNIEHIIAPLLGKEKDTTETSLPWQGVKVRKIAVKNFNFSFDTTRTGATEKPLVCINDMLLALKNVVVGEGIYGNLSKLTLKESNSGMELENLSTYFLYSPSSALIKDFNFKDNWSEIDVPLIQLKYGTPENLRHFADSVEMTAEINNSTIGLGSAGIIDGKFRDSDIKLFISGTIQGRLSNFASKNLYLRTPGEKSQLKVTALVNGLPDIDKTNFQINLKKSHVCIDDIVRTVKELSPEADLSALERFNPSQQIEFNCKAYGNIRKADAKLHVSAQTLGDIDAEIKSTKDDEGRIFGGEIYLTNVNLGTITGNKSLGIATAYAAGWAIPKKDSLRAELVSAEINRLDFNGYSYHDISADCSINGKNYEGEISSLDSNIFFKLLATLSLDDDGADRLYGSGNFSMLDLASTKLIDIDTCMTRFMVDFDIASFADKKVTGKLAVRDMLALVGSELFDIGHIDAESSEDSEGFFSGSLESSLLTASYQGTDYLYGILGDAAALISSNIDHIIPRIKNERAAKPGVWGEFNLITGDLKPIAAILPKNIYVNSGTKFRIRMDDHNKMDLSLTSGLLSYEDKFVKDLNLGISSENGPVNLNLTADMIQSGDTSIDRDTLSASILDNTITAGISYNDSKDKFGQGKINAVVQFPDTLLDSRKFAAQIMPSYLHINGKTLDIKPSSIAFYKNGKIEVEGLKVSNGEHFLSIDGTVSDLKTDTVSVRLNEFELADLNFLIKKNAQLKGIMSGECTASGITGKNLAFIADFHTANLGVDGENLGDLRLLSKWHEEKQCINFLLDNTLGETKPLNISGQFNPNTSRLEAKVEIDKLNIGWIDPFLVAVVDHSSGTASGKLSVEGKLDSLKIRSDGLRVNKLNTNLTYTHVPYVLDGPLEVSENGVKIESLTISDTRGNDGTIKGKYAFKGKDKGKIDLLFDLKNIHGLNMGSNSGEGFYGDAHASGKVRVFGPLNGLRINIDIATADGKIHIPLDEAANAKKRDILTFVDKRDIVQSAYDSIITLRNLLKTNIRRKTGIKCNVRLKLTPLTNVIVDISSANGDRASVVGEGQVDIRAGQGEFDIRGNYMIHEGDCHFSILGITAKEFKINNGGTINFVGPVMQSDFNLSAAYQTKASLETLFGDTQAVSSRRTVNCIINVAGKLDNPEVKFKIDIPDLDPTNKSRMESALSTDEKNLRQGLALLVSGGFIPDQQSGIVNNNTFLYSNASEIVSSQISNIFHQLDIPLDLGLKYQPGSGGIDIFDVAISTQLFNNRVTINGSIGNKEYSSSSSTSDLQGNLDVGIKLNKTGQLKLNIFSHAADQYSNYLDQTQRNGAGITYQEEFATFRDLWNSIFKRKQKQAAR